MSYLMSRYRDMKKVIVAVHAVGDDADTVAIAVILKTQAGSSTIREYVGNGYWPSLLYILESISPAVSQPKTITVFSDDRCRVRAFKTPLNLPCYLDRKNHGRDEIPCIWRVLYWLITYKQWRFRYKETAKMPSVTGLLK